MDAAEWTGRVGQTWAAEWRRTDRSFAGLEPALERMIVAAACCGAPGEPLRMVDLGCGAGTTSLAVAAAVPEAELVGVDLSTDLAAVAEARRDEAGLDPKRCRFVTGDSITAVGALAPVNLFFSRHGVMFFDDPVTAFTRFREAAAPAARLIFSCFTALEDNPWATETVGRLPPPAGSTFAPGPFAFAAPDRVRAILAESGWTAAPPERVVFRYVAGAGDDPVGDAVSFFGRIGPAASALQAAPAAERPALLDRLTAACAARRDGDEVVFPAAAWLWSARAAEITR